jgi:hypothetical protein
MAKRRLTTKIIKALALCALSLLAVILAPNAHAQAQDTERIIKRTQIRNAPVELVDVKLSGQSLLAKESVNIARSTVVWKELKFRADDDWLKGLQFTFKNVSGKPIVAMSVAFLIKIPNSESRWSLPLTPSLKLPPHLQRGRPETETLPPDQNVEFAIRLSELGRIEEMVRSVGATIHGVSAVELRIGHVQFDYDNSWNNGVRLRRDPGDPNKWTPVGQDLIPIKSQSLFRQASFSGKKTNPQASAAIAHPTRYWSTVMLPVYSGVKFTKRPSAASSAGTTGNLNTPNV